MTQPYASFQMLAVADKLVNLVAGIGNSRDKTTYNHHQDVTPLSTAELLAMYRGNWIAAKAVDIYAEDMTRRWRKLSGLDKKIIIEFEKEEKRVKYKLALYDALKWSRLYGGAAIMPIFTTDRPEKMLKPLEIEKIQKGTLKKLVVFDKTMMFPSEIVVDDPFQDNFGQPLFYTVNGSYHKIHHSRVFKLHGYDLPYLAQQTNNYWGDSIIQRMYETINDATTTFKSVAQMMMEMVTDVLKIPHLQSLLAKDDTTNDMIDRFNLMKLLSSISQIKLLDKEEEWERHQIQLPGVNDVISQELTLISASSNIPVTRFIGTSPRGMNATGESDLETHYENVHGKQETDLRPIMERLDEMIFMSVFGRTEPDCAFEFNPLYMQDAKEKADTNKVEYDTRKGYIEMSLIPKHSIARVLIEEGYDIPPEHINALEEEWKADPIGEKRREEESKQKMAGQQTTATAAKKPVSNK